MESHNRRSVLLATLLQFETRRSGICSSGVRRLEVVGKCKALPGL